MKTSGDIPVTEAAYLELTRACDDLLYRPDAPPSIAVLPWLHVINEVPFILQAYSDVLGEADTYDRKIPQPNPFVSVRDLKRHSVFHFAQFIKGFLRSFYFTDSRMIANTGVRNRFMEELGLTDVDVLIITWLVNREHLSGTSDFYFGELQELLFKRGLSSLLVMRNQSGCHSPELRQIALRKGPCARVLLPDTQSPEAEMCYMKQGLALRRFLRHTARSKRWGLEKRLLRKASEFSVITPGLQNLRLHQQIELICRKLAPSMVVTLYEGHAWERCVWHAARMANQRTLCIGYQHTILRKHSHSMKRSLDPHRTGFDPDLILTLGQITQRMLDMCDGLKNIEKKIYGTYRRIGTGAEVQEPKRIPAFLVLPEGVESESIYLFDLALACAISLPDVQFVFRMHPVLAFENVRPMLNGYPSKNGNVELSDCQNIEDDFARTGYVLYRGSSTVMYAILAGLKPYYFERPDEMNFDPIFELTTWREQVRSPEDLIRKFKADQSASAEFRRRQWKEALTYCDQYTRSIQEETLDQMISLSALNK